MPEYTKGIQRSSTDRPTVDWETLFESVPSIPEGMQRSKSIVEFQQLMRQDAQAALRSELDRLLDKAKDEDKSYLTDEFSQFHNLFERFLQERGPSIIWEKINPPPKGMIHKYDEIRENLGSRINGNEREFLSKLVVIKLNGGLGTSMGCTGPKSLISVRSGLNFLDLTVQQIEHLNKVYDVNVPLVLMNSFNTEEDTRKILRKYKNCKVEIKMFNQHRFPRINKETLLPVANEDPYSPKDAWYPPGHGDIYSAFNDSGLLEEFLQAGKDLMFVSNIDNLGATVDMNILAHLISNPETEYCMEVTDKTRADVKGGTLIEYEGRARLLEIAQVPKENVDEFKSVSKFKIFNTNNLWMRLDAVSRLCKSGQIDDMEIIVNEKTLGSGTNVIQLETASGAAIKNFNKAIGINVPRARFLPVKKTSDLMLVMSNLYELKSGSLTMSQNRQFKTTPLVKLGDEHFKKVSKFLNRYKTIPDMLEADHLTVSGDVTFGKDVTMKGTVIIIANHGDRIDIPSGAILENKIVSGNLRILDH